MIFRYACKTNQLNGVPCKLILSFKSRHQGETYFDFDKIFVIEKTWAQPLVLVILYYCLHIVQVPNAVTENVFKMP